VKILLLHQYFLEKNDSGGSRFNEFSRLWAESGHKITVLSGMVHYSTGLKDAKYRNKYTYFDEGFYDGVDVIRCHVSPSYNKNFIGRLWGYFSFVLSSLYAGIFRVKNDYDVILVTSPPLFIGITGYLLSRLKKIPFVFEVRDLWPESAIDTGILTNKILINFAYKMENMFYKKSKKINVLTPAYKTKLIKEKNIKEEKITIIPNGVDFAKIQSENTHFNINEFRLSLGFQDKFVITYVGAHGIANYLMQIIKTAEKFKNSNVIFQLIGDGMEKEMLINESKKRELPNIIFRNSVSKKEVFKYILSSDVGISVLKKNETFKTIYSNKTFDYMSCKIPILMVIDGISRSLVQKVGCGIYAEPENIDSIVTAVELFLLKNSKELKTMGQLGYDYVTQNHDRGNLSKEYISLMKSIIRQ